MGIIPIETAWEETGYAWNFKARWLHRHRKRGIGPAILHRIVILVDMRIVVITDVHANLQALQALLQAIRTHGYDALYHTGDAIAIGPQPAECLELLLDIPKARFVIGNHETYFLDGLPTPQPSWMSDGEVRHQRWTHARLGPHMRSAIKAWPYSLQYDFEGVRTAFLHYALDGSGRDFFPLVKPATSIGLEVAFSSLEAQLVFFGHDHAPIDVQGQARYINPGSLGCCEEALARYCIVEFSRGRYEVKHSAVPYDDTALFQAFERRQVPERAFIYRAFFGGRFRASPS
jgi:predicted phosphodiesterase